MDTILWPIQIAVAWIMVNIHKGLVFLGFSDGSGPAWVLSIVGLTLTIRILIIPLFFKQIKASRGMQLMQPDLQALQKKYKGKTDPVSRQAQQQEMQELYKKHNSNPFSSCLPMLLQMPIFFALFRVLNQVSILGAGQEVNGHSAIGPLTMQLASDMEQSTLFGAPLSATFIGSDAIGVKIVAAILVVVMGTTQFISIKQLSMKNMPASAMDNPVMRQQKIMLYVMPVVFAVSGVAFPIGVLIYWTISNLWSMGQQAYTIRRQPSPGSEAYKAKQVRDAAKREKKGLPPIEDDPARTEEVQPTGQRVQPVGKNRAKKKGVQGGTPVDQEPEEDAAGNDAVEEENEDLSDATRVGKDGLTDEERARKRYEARAAEREVARQKRLAAEKKRKANEAKGKYNKD
ncbi:MAG: membrane protein insertase YidC [Ruaniaceae bacterium]|nr:membrane protein insertase YidC [Ruaniaceae bacterium]